MNNAEGEGRGKGENKQCVDKMNERKQNGLKRNM
jgi:hypothetical protein